MVYKKTSYKKILTKTPQTKVYITIDSNKWWGTTAQLYHKEFAYKQCGLLDAELNAIKTIKNENEYYSKHYLEIKEKLLDLIDGNGFGVLSAKKFEKYYKDTGVDFDEWMKKQPKYDVRNAKFIYPEISECEYLSLH